MRVLWTFNTDVAGAKTTALIREAARNNQSKLTARMAVTRNRATRLGFILA